MAFTFSAYFRLWLFIDFGGIAHRLYCILHKSIVFMWICVWWTSRQTQLNSWPSFIRFDVFKTIVANSSRNSIESSLRPSLRPNDRMHFQILLWAIQRLYLSPFHSFHMKIDEFKMNFVEMNGFDSINISASHSTAVVKRLETSVSHSCSVSFA